MKNSSITVYKPLFKWKFWLKFDTLIPNDSVNFWFEKRHFQTFEKLLRYCSVNCFWPYIIPIFFILSDNEMTDLQNRNCQILTFYLVFFSFLRAKSFFLWIFRSFLDLYKNCLGVVFYCPPKKLSSLKFPQSPKKINPRSPCFFVVLLMI